MFTIVIPCFNRANKIAAALDSVLNQTYEHFECIVVDDGSTDNTESIVSLYLQDSRIQYIKKSNGGPASARNVGIIRAKYPYIAFLDSDDTWFSNKLLEVSRHIENDNSDLLYHNLYLKYEELPTIRKIGKSFISKDLKRGLFCEGYLMPTSSLVLKTSIARKALFREDKILIGIEDYEFAIRASQMIDKFTYIDKPLGYYLESIDSLSNAHNIITRNVALLMFVPELITQGHLYYGNGIAFLANKQREYAFKSFVVYLVLSPGLPSILRVLYQLIKRYFFAFNEKKYYTRH